MVNFPIPEIWKDIKGYEGSYQVSSLGDIKSLKRIILKRDGARHPFKERILKQSKTLNGYYQVSLRNTGKLNTQKIHRIVMATFEGESDLQVNHINGDKSDNRFVNLEYVKHLENMNHRYTILRRQKRYGVTLNKRTNKWESRIKNNNKITHIGTYKNKDKAYEAFYNAYVNTHGVAPWLKDEL